MKNFEYFVSIARQVMEKTSIDLSVLTTCMHEAYQLGYQDKQNETPTGS